MPALWQKYRLKARVIFLCLFICSIGYGQNPPFISYSEQSGLSTSVVYGLFQDTEDNIWFCTNSGVVKFNGNKLTTYEKKDGLSSNEVFKIFEDSRHRLWFMTATGRLSYYKDKKIYNESDHPAFRQITPGSYISDIREDDQHNLWVVPDNGTVFSITPDLDRVSRYPGMIHNGIFFMFRGRPYLSSREGIFSLDSQRLVIPSPNYHPGSLMIRHWREGDHVYSGRDGMIEEFDLPGFSVHSIPTPDLPVVLNSIVIIDSFLYICSNKGLSIYSARSFEKAGQYFSTENVSHVLKDREGSIWVSTLNDGVRYIPNSRINFLRSSEYFQGNKILKLNGLGEHVIIGQSNSKITYYKQGIMSSVISPYESKGEGLTYLIKAIPGDSSFLISNQSGLTQFSLNGRRSFKQNLTILGIEFYDQDSMYISTPSILGKFSREFKSSDFTYLRNPFAFDSLRTDALYFDTTDRILYACGRKGLSRYSDRKKLPNRYPQFDGLSLTDIDKTKQGIFVISTYGDGVFFIHKDQVVNMNEKSGLSNNMCSSVYVQNDSTIWVTTYNGLNRIRYYLVEGEIRLRVMNFYRNDGLPSNYINDIYIYRDSIWLATNVGLALFKENDLTRYSYTPKIAIEAFRVNGSIMPFSPDKTISLDRNSNSVAIEFNCNTFKNAGSVGYRYKLSGLNSNWMETRNSQVDFNGLDPGHYTFEVYAYSLNGNWESEVARISFSIKPALWETVWFRALCLLLFLAIAIWAIFYQFRKVKNEFAVQQKIMNYEKELLELEQQALRLQMNPHFIFNALNSIQHAILSGKQDVAYHHLELFSSLIRGILENSKHKFITLEDEIGILKIYMQIEATRFEGDFKYEVIIDPRIDISCIMIPPMLIQPFVENSIWHGLMPKTSGEKKLTLSFSSEGDDVICKVEDNGIGRKKAALRKEKKQGTSLGTILTMNRLANINLLENKRYTIDIVDKDNDEGTIVTIRIQL